MRGNQAVINGQILTHEKNPIKENIGEHSPEYILHVIMTEYWKEWRHLMTNCETPYIFQKGLGVYKLQYNYARKYIYTLIGKLRWYKVKFENEWNVPGTKGNDIYLHAENKLRIIWKQTNELKKEINLRYATWRQKKIDKYGDKAIL